MFIIKPLEFNHVYNGLVGTKLIVNDCFGNEFARLDYPETYSDAALEAWKLTQQARYDSIIRNTIFSLGSFNIGDQVEKKSGSWWEGKIVGLYSTEQTPVGYAVQLPKINGPVQIYPESALQLKTEKLI